MSSVTPRGADGAVRALGRHPSNATPGAAALDRGRGLGIVHRGRLLERLRAHPGPVVISAPAGFGKSILIEQWARAMDASNELWLACALDDVPAVVSRMRDVVSGLVRPMRDMEETGPPGPSESSDLDRLLDALDRHGRSVTVVVEGPADRPGGHAWSMVDHLLHVRPRTLRLVVVARGSPPLRTAGLRASGALLDLGMRDLAFDIEEASSFLADHGVVLSDRSVEALLAQTEGWAAGLRLAVGAIKGAPDTETMACSFDGSDRRVRDFFREEVLTRPGIREHEAFLLATSVLDELSGPICDAVMAQLGSATTLSALESAGAFLVRLDEAGDRFRYHRMLKGSLDHGLSRDPARAALAHGRAGQWLAREGRVAEAVGHLLAAGRTDDAIVVVSKAYMSAVEVGDVASVAGWLELFPRAVVSGDVRLSVIEAWVMSFLQRPAESDIALDNARRGRHRGPLPDGSSSVEASAALIRAGAPRGDVAGMLAAARKAFALEASPDSPWRVTVHALLGIALYFSGQSGEALPLLERGAALARASERWLEEVGTRCVSAWALLDLGRPQDARRAASYALRVSRSSGLAQTPYGGYAEATSAAVSAWQHRRSEAAASLESALSRMREGVEPYLVAQCLIELIRLRMAAGDVAGARNALDDAGAILRDFRDAGVLPERLRRASEPLQKLDRPLSRRELEVLRLLNQGLSKRQAALVLFVTFDTVHSHTRAIYRKLGVSSRSQALARAKQRDLL